MHVSGTVIFKFTENSEWIMFSERLIRTQAQLLVDGGYLAAGYKYMMIDDCWLNHSRAAVNFKFQRIDVSSSHLYLGWLITTR